MIEVYTDGSCERNPGGRGGWGWVVSEDLYGCGGVASTTSNRMEIMAIFEAVRVLPDPLVVFSDSTYAVNCASGKWARKKNLDLWVPFMSEVAGRDISFRWVKGHSGVLLNEVADRLAYRGMVGRSLPLRDGEGVGCGG